MHCSGVGKFGDDVLTFATMQLIGSIHQNLVHC